MSDQPAPAGPEAPVGRLAGIVQRCGLCDDSVEQLDFHINRVHRMMTDRYHALVGGFAEAGRRAAEMEAERDAAESALGEATGRVDALEDELEVSRAALPDPGKLWTLADWIDTKYPNDANPEVQTDLRLWARSIFALGLHAGARVPGVCDIDHAAAPDGAAR